MDMIDGVEVGNPTTANVREANNGGDPSSVTMTVTRLVEAFGVGRVHVNTPVLPLMVAPAGAFDPRLNVKALAGRSASIAVFVMMIVLPAKFVRSAIAARTGAVFTSFTTTVKLCVAVKVGTPSSATCTEKVFVLGPWASVGVQVMTPLESIAAPEGAVNVYVRVPPSGSVATVATVRRVCSLTF